MDRFEQNRVESGGIELEGIKKTGLGLTNPDFVTACLEGFEPPTFWFVAKHSYRYTAAGGSEALQSGVAIAEPYVAISPKVTPYQNKRSLPSLPRAFALLQKTVSLAQ